MHWYHLAAEQGDADAQYLLGAVYHDGDWVDQDHEQAAQWWRLAAEQGHELAQEALREIGTTKGIDHTAEIIPLRNRDRTDKESDWENHLKNMERDLGRDKAYELISRVFPNTSILELEDEIFGWFRQPSLLIQNPTSP